VLIYINIKTNLRFADDIVVIPISEEDIQKALKEYDLKINADKTKSLVYYKKNIPST